ncbi:hypothetical protein PR202_ga19166 [Eleusine coracana subsp. coracana]|uniref:DUF674 family protein n=1 Tax=Eleusine coracana subsp. coracana TaxID=191504 RepID=A0AAV5CUE1_ELECO|nr:hypothetical protein PR202_ga19166 [Eleusine coracana subsp. coracana]
MDAGPTVAVKLFIDKEKQKVLFAESDKDFVDVLFSFLTLPLGTIVRVLGLMFSILEKFELNENANIDEKIINFLKRALICKQPLCGLCFDAAITPDSVDLDELPANLFPKQENDNVNEFNAIKIKLIQAADDSSVVYAEVGHDFVDLVFGLLAVPLGSIIKAYAKIPKEKLVEKELALDRKQIMKILRAALITREALSSALLPPKKKRSIAQEKIAVPHPKYFLNSTMSKSEEPTIEVKLFVDHEKRKVLFAESDKEFVDVLFSFLAMPLGTIVRLLDKQSQIGCLDEIYRSVDALSLDCFETKACKGMLLAPLNAASSHCARLKINVDGTKSNEVYVCKGIKCCARVDKSFSSVPDSVCKCGKVMESFGQSSQNDYDYAGDSKVGVFVEGCSKFIITDDLQVAPASTSLMLYLFEKLGVRDPANLKQEFHQFSSEKITRLLKRALTSKQPLTGHYFDVPVPHDEDASLHMLRPNLYPGQIKEVEDTLDNLKIRVLQMKNSSALLYAEVGGDFVDFLFGLLSVPIGSIIKSFGQCSSNDCLYNLYKSIEDGNPMRPERQSLLLAPKLAPFFGCCASRILQVDELAPKDLKINACFSCFKTGGFSDLVRCHSSPSTIFLIAMFLIATRK